MKRFVTIGTFLITMAMVALGALAGSYTSSTDDPPNNVDRIMHPNGYTGAGGTVSVTVCVDPASPFSQEMIAPLTRAVETWDAMTPTNDNVSPSSTVPTYHIDFESTVLHELGHCALGLGHINEPLLGLFTSGFTEATPGPNGVEDQDNGIDGIQGSADDVRGDDINVVWYRKVDNNPFMLSGVVDTSTYSRDLMDLPNTGGHDKYVQNANSSVASNIFSLPDARAIMFTSRSQKEEQRTLGFDDVATVRLAQSGVDEMEGTADDYTIELDFIGKVANCQVVVRFETPPTGSLGQCESTPGQISGDHYSLDPQSVIRLNPDPAINWHFGDSPDLSITLTDGGVSVAAGDSLAYTVEVVNVG